MADEQNSGEDQLQPQRDQTPEVLLDDPNKDVPPNWDVFRRNLPHGVDDAKAWVCRIRDTWKLEHAKQCFAWDQQERALALAANIFFTQQEAGRAPTSPQLLRSP